MNPFVNALKIRKWADKLEARSALPRLIRRLVLATTRDLSELDFPAGESVQRSGFDGVVVSGTGNAWVPQGRSVWELGVSKGVKAKADSDFENRTQKPPTADQLETTFVFVTPRHWEIKRAWAADREEKGQWKGVRAFDADDIEQWLELAPAVAAWLGNLIRARPEGVDDLETRWTAITDSTTRELLPQVFLVAREKTVIKVEEWLRADAACLRIHARSPAEVVDFICAAVAAMNEPERMWVYSRAVIVETERAWKILRDGPAETILVVDPAIDLTSEEIARAIRNGNHVLLAAGPDSRSSDTSLELPRAGQFELRQVLEACGCSPAEAEQKARAAAGSLAILKRQLARYPDNYCPEWAARVQPEAIAACLLLGGWSGNTLADREAVARITDRPYEDLESYFQQMAHSRDPLLLHALQQWRVISKDEAWAMLCERVSAVHLERFASLAVEVLIEDDRSLALPDDDLDTAGTAAGRKGYSATIRQHIAEVLAYLGTFGESLQIPAAVNLPALVNRVVSQVLGGHTTCCRWASLERELPLLAEASPQLFLKAVAEDLAAPSPRLAGLFRDDQPMINGCHHAGLLWALECLAWSRKHVISACECLLALHSIDPGGSWSNRPLSSLWEILSPLNPQTTASVQERIILIDRLIKKDSDSAWALLLQLLEYRGTSIPTHSPYWRDWGTSWQTGVTYAEHHTFVLAIGERAVEQAGTNAARWTQVIEKIGRLPDEVLPRIAPGLRTLVAVENSDENRRPLADELRRQISLHRRLRDAEWSFPFDQISELEEVLEQLLPADLVVRYQYLFARWVDLDDDLDADHEERTRKVEAAREQALIDILQVSGLTGIKRFYQDVEHPDSVGHVLAVATEDQFLDDIVPAKFDGNEQDRRFAAGYVLARFWPEDWDWLDAALKRCETAAARAHCLSVLPFCPETWQRVDSAGEAVVSLYWSKCQTFRQDLDSADVERAVTALTQVGRIADAVQLIAFALQKAAELSTETLFLPLESLLKRHEQNLNRQEASCKAYQVRQIVKVLQERSDTDADRLIAIEWHFLEILEPRQGFTPRTVMQRLASDPEFFMKVLSDGYPPRSSNDPVSKPTKQDRFKARQAFALLHRWQIVPGTLDDGTVDEQSLRAWCVEVRQRAEQIDRLGNCDSYIGKVLVHAPSDDDGCWPCQAVRRVVEEIATDSLEDSLRMGILNSRGWIHRSNGGDKERSLTAKYSALADKVRFDSPFFSDLLDKIADSYMGEAGFWDERDRWEE